MLTQKYGVDGSIARDIIRCESSGNADAINKNSSVGEDIGYWQLNSHYWKDEMAKRGWDIYNEADNLEAGFWLMSTKGTDPWIWSKPCWSK